MDNKAFFDPKLDAQKKTDLILSLGFGLVAFVVYAITSAKGLYPGESASLFAKNTGLVPRELPLHPVWGWITGAIANVRLMNIFSGLCTAVSVALVYRIVSHFVYGAIEEEFAKPHNARAATLAGATAAVAFTFASPVWECATRLQYQSFDLMLAFVCAGALVSFSLTPSIWKLGIFSVFLGLGLGESIMFAPLAPILVALLVFVLFRANALALGKVVACVAIAAVAAVAVYWVSVSTFFASEGELAGFAKQSDVLVALLRVQATQLTTGLPRVNWLLLLLFSAIPWIAGMLAGFRALNNERTWSEYLLHLTLTVLVILGLSSSPVSPWEILRPLGKLPVASSAMLAMAAGYLVAFWYILMKVRRNKRGTDITTITMKTGSWMGWLLAYPLAVIVCIVAIVNAFSCTASKSGFADECARRIIDGLDGRTWFVTDGLLDPHLLFAAKQKGAELNLVCLQNDMSPSYLKTMGEKIEEKKLFQDPTLGRMKNTLKLGILPFLQDWFASDKEIEKKAVAFGVPDFWYIADCQPLPEKLFFGGIRNAKPEQGEALAKNFMDFWSEMEKILAPKRALEDTPLDVHRQLLRRHVGFVANNLGVMLEDLAESSRAENTTLADTLEANAFSLYTCVHDQIDPANVSAMFNRFEMARRGVSSAAAQRDTIENELKSFVQNLKQKYPLYSLSRIYGYVRSPEIFARLGWGWALSGQTGAALEGVNRAINLLPAGQRSGAMEAMAAVYALAEDRQKTESVYQSMLKENPQNANAMLGLARLSMQEGAMDKAKDWLEQAAKVSGKKDALGVEWAVVHLMNNDLAQARMILQRTCDLQPKNLQAWSLLAMVQVQQDELSDVEKVTIPKMENIAGTSDNYYIQIARAQAALKRASRLKQSSEATLEARRRAREAFIHASALKPEVPGVKDIILQLDIEMNDRQAADLHARQVLRRNRKHPLANYIMGSLRLQEGEYGEAEDFLRRSVEGKQIPAALNDLAETLRRIKRLPEAEEWARKAVAAPDTPYVAWETLAAILLEQNKNLDEAETCVNKALSLFGEDLRIKTTLAKILLAKGEVERARILLHQVKSRQGELGKFEREELEAVLREADAAKLK